MATKKAAAKVATSVKKAAPVVVVKPQKSAEQLTVKVNEAARIKTGEYAGLVGVVLSVDVENYGAMVKIEGVREGEKIDVLGQFFAPELEPNK